MRLYRLLISRTVTMTNNIYVEGNSEEDAITRFQHQLESESCSGLEDEESWGEAYYNQVVKAGPYTGDFAVLEAEELVDHDEEPEESA